ncbi:MAG: phytanoyl-CoA dioxygenase family protein [Telmatospirillum sp.]|nr:phytanoyl-CoA dioxygenase family protein [Telmatospirillum sp.]
MTNDHCDDGFWEGARAAGWSFLPGLLTPAEVRRVREELAGLSATPDLHPDCMYYVDVDAGGGRHLARVERIWEALPSLGETGIGRRLKECAARYLGEDVALFKDKLNIRYAGSNGYSPHQDSAAGWEEFADHFVSIGVFLGTSDRAHGGFEVVGGVHRDGRFPNDKGRMSDAFFDGMDRISVSAGLGDAIVLDSEAPHRTLPNRTSEDALHLLFTFAPARAGAAREAYYARKESSFSEKKEKNIFEFRVFSFQ